MEPELRLLNLHFFNICRHHPTLKFKPHATDDERYVSGVDGVPLTSASERIYFNADRHVLLSMLFRRFMLTYIMATRPLIGLNV